MWYAVQTPAGREAEMAEKLNRVYSGESDKPCFVLSKERSWRMGGIYHIGVEPMFPGYIFVDTDDDVRIIRRIKRDMEERGRSLDSVIEQYLGVVKPMYHQFIEPTKRYADVIIPEGVTNTVAIDLITTKIEKILSESREG